MNIPKDLINFKLSETRNNWYKLVAFEWKINAIFMKANQETRILSGD
jgi:hypothetical protein